MHFEPPAAERAKSLLFTASRRLDTDNPVAYVGRELDASLRRPVGDPAYSHSRMIEPDFNETSDGLSFLMDTAGPDAGPKDRLDSALHTMRRMVGQTFGDEATYWMDGRTEAIRGSSHHGDRFGAWMGAGFDHEGLRDALLLYEWNPTLTDALPSALYNISRIAMQALPGLRPVFGSVRCGRSAGGQQISFTIDVPLALSALKPLMDALHIGEQHASLMSACAFALGARFTLPPNTAMLTLRPLRHGVELRLDVDLDAIPDTPTQFLSLIRMQMAERPVAMRKLDRWLMALTPEGYAAAGHFSVLSLRVAHGMPARVALFLRPSAFDPSVETPAQPAMPEHAPPPEHAPRVPLGEARVPIG